MRVCIITDTDNSVQYEKNLDTIHDLKIILKDHVFVMK